MKLGPQSGRSLARSAVHPRYFWKGRRSVPKVADPKLAILRMLTKYADNPPLGKVRAIRLARRSQIALTHEICDDIRHLGFPLVEMTKALAMIPDPPVKGKAPVIPDPLAD